MVGQTNSRIDSILVGRCNCDITVGFPYFWAKDIIGKAQRLGFNVIDLKKDNFTSDCLSKEVSKKIQDIFF